MFNIKEFLNKIQGIQMRGYRLRVAVKDAVMRHTSMEVPAENIEITSSTVTLRGISQAARSAIFIKKEAILDEINAGQAIRKISNIR